MTNNIQEKNGYVPTRVVLLDFLVVIRKNPLAALGLFIVMLIIFLIVSAPWICQNSPTQIYPWIGAKPPGTTHPVCFTENTFELFKTPKVPPKLLKGKKLEFIIFKKEARKFRIAVRRGKISNIIQVKGAVPVNEIDLTAESDTCREFHFDDKIGRILPKVKLRVGDFHPPNFFHKGQRVLFLEILKGKTETSCSIFLDSGIVKSVYRDGVRVDKITIPGESVLGVTLDGRKMIRTSILGTDNLGRDLFSRVLYGGGISLMVGIIATLVSLFIGVIYGATSAHLGGRIDRFMMGLIDILYSLPFMFLVIILLVLFGRNIIILFVALGAVQWLTMARIIRGQILSLKEMEFISAAQVCGASFYKILFKHLIPNSIGPMIIYTSLTIPIVIMEESFLAFLGLSIQYKGQNLDSWGALIFQGMQSLGSTGSKSWLLLCPATAMILTLFGLNVLGDGLRDYFDPKRKNF